MFLNKKSHQKQKKKKILRRLIGHKCTLGVCWKSNDFIVQKIWLMQNHCTTLGEILSSRIQRLLPLFSTRLANIIFMNSKILIIHTHKKNLFKFSVQFVDGYMNLLTGLLHFKLWMKIPSIVLVPSQCACMKLGS